MRLSVAVIFVAFSLVAQERPIDTARSTITIHVGKSGLFSAAAHDHTIDAPIAVGSMEFTVEAAKMTVRSDPKVDVKTQATIQADMENMTLEVMKFPQVTFRSSRVEKIADGQWKVEGDLSLHGVMKPVSLTARQTGESYSARTVIKQTDFGIKPISIGGGMIKVKNEVEIDFQIFAGR
jgi:polyisoprenoid-binding protein YceI